MTAAAQARDFSDVGQELGDDAIRAAVAGAPRAPRFLPVVDPASWEGRRAPMRRWSVAGWIPLHQATLLTGKGGVGKSLLAQQLCTCIALGVPFLGADTARTAALYVSCEDDIDELWRRQESICKALGVPLSALKDRLLLVSLAGMEGNHLATFDGEGRLSASERYRELVETAKARRVGFAALDNASHFMVGDHNDLTAVAAFLNLLNGLALAIDGSTLILHHPNKAGQDWLGSVAWENQVRSRLLMKPGDEEGDRDSRALVNPKANYAPRDARIDFRWHEGAFVRDDDLSPEVAQEIAATALAASDNLVFLACLAERNRQQRPVSEKVSKSYAPSVFSEMPESKGIGKPRLERAMDRLFRINAIERGFLWRDTAEGKDRHGLREVSANAPANRPITTSANVRSPLPPTSANTRPPLKGRAAAPRTGAQPPVKGSHFAGGRLAPGKTGL